MNVTLTLTVFKRKLEAIQVLIYRLQFKENETQYSEYFNKSIAALLSLAGYQ